MHAIRGGQRKGAAYLARLGLLAGAITAGSCRESEPVGPPVFSERLQLRPRGEALEYTSRTVGTLAVPPELEQWSLLRGKGEVVVVTDERGQGPAAEEPFVRILAGDEQARLLAPVAVSEPFNVVEVALRSRSDKLSLQLASQAGTQTIARSERQRVPKGDLDLVRFELQPDNSPIVPTELSLRVFAGSGVVDVGGMRLNSVPARAAYPDPAGEPKHLEIAGESRVARALSSRCALVGRATIPPGGRLAFAWGAHRRSGSGRSQGSVLVVRVRSFSGAGHSFRVPLDDPGERWVSFDESLANFAGQTVSLTFELKASSPDEEVCALAEACVYAPHPNATTVLLVTSDTHRGDHFGLAPDNVGVVTPTMDALGRRGVVFDAAFSATNITNASHVALLTGVHPRDTGIFDNSTRLGEAAMTLAERFAEAGFATWAVTSAKHLQPRTSGLAQGFDRYAWPTSAQRRGPETLAVLEQWLAERRGQPLFLWLHFFDVHGPFDPPEPHRSRVWPPDQDPFDPNLPDPGIPVAALKKHRMEGLRDPLYPKAMYRGEVEHLDEVMQSVFDHPRFANAIVALTGDHGESLGQHGIHYCHGGLYPDTIRVPLLLAFPGAPAGARVSTPVTNIDLGRTLLDLAKLHHSEFPGTNLLRAIERQPAESAPVFAIGSFQRMASITEGRWHLIVTLYAHTRVEYSRPRRLHETELFDLSTDPTCDQDLVDVDPERAGELRRRLREWLASAEPTGWNSLADVDAELLAALESLGYVGDGDEEQSQQSAGLAWSSDCSCPDCQRF